MTTWIKRAWAAVLEWIVGDMAEWMHKTDRAIKDLRELVNIGVDLRRVLEDEHKALSRRVDELASQFRDATKMVSDHIGEANKMIEAHGKRLDDLASRVTSLHEVLKAHALESNKRQDELVDKVSEIHARACIVFRNTNDALDKHVKRMDAIETAIPLLQQMQNEHKNKLDDLYNIRANHLSRLEALERQAHHHDRGSGCEVKLKPEANPCPTCRNYDSDEAACLVPRCNSWDKYEPKPKRGRRK